MAVVQDFAHGAAADAWARQPLHDVKHVGRLPLLAAIEEARKKPG